MGHKADIAINEEDKRVEFEATSLELRVRFGSIGWPFKSHMPSDLILGFWIFFCKWIQIQ
jgi:hypothetical protein